MRNVFLGFLLLATGSGCSGALPFAGDRETFDGPAARQLLVVALEAWKSGQVATLARRNPPLRFTDDDHVAGWQLVDYRLLAPDLAIRRFESVPVELKLRQGQGPITVRTANYQITLPPRPAVLRTDP
jgi:hypothetical protein